MGEQKAAAQRREFDRVVAESLQHQLTNQTKDSTIILREREVQELQNDNKYLKSIIEQKAKEHQCMPPCLETQFISRTFSRFRLC